MVLHPHGIACTHFLKIEFVVFSGGFYYYYNHLWNRLDKERKIIRKKLSLMYTIRSNTFFEKIGAISYECNSPCWYNSTFTIQIIR